MTTYMRTIVSVCALSLLMTTGGCKSSAPPATIKDGAIVDPYPPDIKKGDLVDPFVVYDNKSLVQASDALANSYVCHCDCSDGVSSGTVGTDLRVCVRNEDNPNFAEFDGSPADPAADCSGRVQDTLQGLATACNYPSQCSCTAQPTGSEYHAECELPCTEKAVLSDCSNFDPENGLMNATNATGDEPVCSGVVALNAAVFGQRSACVVSGSVDVQVEGEQPRQTAAAGIVEIDGTPCPGATCSVGIHYDLELAPITFDTTFQQEAFENLATIGRSMPGQEAAVSSGGSATFAARTIATTARGSRGGDAQAYLALNDDSVSLKALWGGTSPSCSLSGALIGSADPELKRCEGAGPDAGKICASDGDCADVPECSDEVCNCKSVDDVLITANATVGGKLINQPPVAYAGPDKSVECETAAATSLVLDGSGSTDADSNIGMYHWFKGDRTGSRVGTTAKSNVTQPLGGETYVLRVIDAYAQADEDELTVAVRDSIAPAVTCSVNAPIVWQPSPPDHALVNVGYKTSAVDTCEGNRDVSVSVFSNEDDETATDNKGTIFSPDAANIASSTLRLRDERVDSGKGRVYLIVSKAKDTSGNVGLACCSAVVPHDQRSASITKVKAAALAAVNYCYGNKGAPPVGYTAVGDGPVIGKKQ